MTRLAQGTRSSVPVEKCQVCESPQLERVFFAGYLPPVNGMPSVGSRPVEQPAYPAELLRCAKCTLVQLGTIVDPEVLFPPSYPYTSGTTRILRENFAELAKELKALFPLDAASLVVDIGSNDGTLLSNFRDAGHRVFGIDPTDKADLANSRGIPSKKAFFNRQAVEDTLKEHGKARVVTAANVFAHIENVREIVRCVDQLLDDDGIFVTESHYLVSLLETVQYDTVYHEHLRYYALGSLSNLLALYGFEVFHAKRIPTHGGSIRVYAARSGRVPVRDSVAQIRAMESRALTPEVYRQFVDRVVMSKLGLHSLMRDIKQRKERVYGVGAPSRASTLINYVGLTEDLVDCVLEVKGSHKIGLYVPGTLIPVVDEEILARKPPEYLLLFSWHIADELIPKLRAGGFRGKFIVPLPEARVVD